MKKDLLYPLRRIHGYLYELKLFYLIRNKYKRIFKEKPKTIFLLMTPQGGNLGDHAISLAEISLLSELGYNIIEITRNELIKMRSLHQLSALNGFPIVFTGGGYLGSLWFADEMLLREIVKHNLKSKIILFPNTIYYEDSDTGSEEFEKSKKIYNSHKHFLIYAREERSYSVMKDAYENVKIIPDIVFSLSIAPIQKSRNGCLLCFRHDQEKTISDADTQLILQQVRALFSDEIQYTDMISENKVITPAQREEVVLDKLTEFSKAKLVITDRLHGMIFCALTGTPCIVVNSKSPKVRGCYEWIKDLVYIKFAEDVSDIIQLYKSIPECEFKYDYNTLRPYYDELEKDILRFFEAN